RASQVLNSGKATQQVGGVVKILVGQRVSAVNRKRGGHNNVPVTGEPTRRTTLAGSRSSPATALNRQMITVASRISGRVVVSFISTGFKLMYPADDRQRTRPAAEVRGVPHLEANLACAR